MKKYKNIRRMISLCLSLVCVASVSVFPCDAVKYTDWDKLPPKDIDITELPPPSSDYWTLNVYYKQSSYWEEDTGSYNLRECDSWEKAFQTKCGHFLGTDYDIEYGRVFPHCKSTEYTLHIVEPTCTYDGKVYIECSGTYFDTSLQKHVCLYRTFPSLGGHKFDSEVIQKSPTDYEKGKKLCHCEQCDSMIVVDILPTNLPEPSDNDFWEYPNKYSSDFEGLSWDDILNGECGATCRNYETGDLYECEYDIEIETLSPSCTNSGYVRIHCSSWECDSDGYGSRGGHTLLYHNYPELGHDPSDAGFVIEEPTCTRPGKAFKHCLRCERDYEETIQKLWHDYQWKTTSPITGTNSGLDELACTRCSDVSNRRIVQNIPGDADLSGSVNASDLLLMKQSFAGVESLTENQQILADVNKNGSADARDVIQLKKLFAGIIDTLE